MFTRKRISIVLAGISLVIALGVGVTTARMQSTRTNDGLPRFGLVGIAPGQVARLNAVNALSGIAPCILVRLGFVDADGLPIHDRAGNKIAREVELMPGQGAWLDLDSRDVLSFFQSRKQIRPVVTIAPVAGIEPQPFMATLEIFNKLTGRTEVLYAPVGVTPPEPPAPPR